MARGKPAGRPSGTGDTDHASEEPSQAGSRRWDTSSLSMASPNALTPIAIPTLAPIPSPLAGIRILADERASTGVKELFTIVRRVSVQQDVNFNLLEKMLAGSPPMIAPLSIDREAGFVVYLERRKLDTPELEPSHDPATSFELRYEWIRNNHHFIKLDAVQPVAQTGKSVPSSGSCLEIRRLSSSNSVADTIQRFFIYTSANTSLRVNGVIYQTNTILGPLPDFAVIEAGGAAVFWWHTDESIDYLPDLRDQTGSRKRPLNVGEDYINLVNNRPSKKQKLTEGSEDPRQTSRLGSSPSGAPTSHPARPRTNLSPVQIQRRPYLLRNHGPPKPPPRMPKISGPGLPPKGAPEVQGPLRPPPPIGPPTQPGQAPKLSTAGPPPPSTDPPKQPGQPPQPPTAGPPPPANKPSKKVKPKSKGPKRANPSVGTISGLGGGVWWHEFQRSLREMQAEASKTPDDENSGHQIALPDFRYDDAAMAIACLWEGVKLRGINYAFGDPGLFRYARRRVWSSQACVGATDPLIMPLEFSESIIDPEPEEESDVKPVPPRKSVAQMQKEEREILKAEDTARKERMETKSGAEKWDTGPKQFALAIARRDPSSDSGVFITYTNNASTRSQGIIRAAARNIVRHSSWMPEGAWPTFSREVWQTVPQQTEKFTGGMHLILNTWAEILNLAVNETWLISTEEQTNFDNDARTVINLALRGHMDGETIIGLLAGYGYAQYPKTSQTRLLPRKMRSVFMHHGVLNDIIHRMRNEARDATVTASNITAGPVVQPPPITNKPLPPPKSAPPKIAPPRAVRDGILVQGKTEWASTLQTRLNDCEAKYQKLGIINLVAVREEQLSDEDVVLGIAAVWRGLWTNDLQFAFGTANLFRLARKASAAGKWHGSVSVGGPNDYIIPLLLHPDDIKSKKRRIGSARSTAGHFLLVIATRDSADSRDVTIQILDSAAGAKDLDYTRKTARNIVRYSGWMGLTPEGVPVNVRPNFSEEVITVPQQTGAIECGFHVIFNAWAHMLGIPIINNSQRSGTLSDAEFYRVGVRIVNLALAGCMDSGTIQAFFNHFGYCEAQDPADAVQAMESVMMDDDILADIIEEIVDEEKAIAANPAPPALAQNGDEDDDEDEDEDEDDGDDGDGDE